MNVDFWNFKSSSWLDILICDIHFTCFQSRYHNSILLYLWTIPIFLIWLALLGKKESIWSILQGYSMIQLSVKLNSYNGSFPYNFEVSFFSYPMDTLHTFESETKFVFRNVLEVRWRKYDKNSRGMQWSFKNCLFLFIL